MLIVAKFGGSSLADSRCCRAVGEILRADAQRRCVVVSAPGRRSPGDRKMTDLLYDCWEARNSAWEPILQGIFDRFETMAEELEVAPDWREEQLRLRAAFIGGSASRDYVASRGEYFCAKLMAAYLDRPFLDSADWLCLREDGSVDVPRTYGRLWKRPEKSFVTPGFYGALPDGTIRTLPRGGSDVTGALAAAALHAGLYENWTDVPGILQADPADFPEARPVRFLTYRELDELGAMGVQVLHSGAIAPVRDAEIPLVIRSTRQPDDPGTQIAPALPADARRGRLLCLAERRDRALVSLERPGRLGDLLKAENCRADFLTEFLGRQTAAVSAADFLNSAEALSAASGGVSVRTGLSLIAVLFAKEAARGPKAADLLAALGAQRIRVYSILRPFDSSILLLAVEETCRCRAVRVLLSAAQTQENADPFGA